MVGCSSGADGIERGTQFQMWKLWKSFLFTEDKEVLFPFMLLQITEARWMNQRKTFGQDRTSHPDRFLYLSKPTVLGIANGRADRSTEKVKKTCHRYLPVVQLGFERK